MNTQIGRNGLPTKRQINNFLSETFPRITTSYSGRNKTLYIYGKDHKDAKLALYKTYPGLAIRFASAEERPVQEARNYYFQNDGTILYTDTASNIVFHCKARNARNAKRKYGNYIDSFIAATGVKAKS